MKKILCLISIMFVAGSLYAGIVHKTDKVITDEIDAKVGTNPLQISTNTYIIGYSSAATYYGDGSNLTGISTNNDHQLLDELQGGSSGAITNSDNVPFTNSGNYSFNASEISVTGGLAKLKSSGALDSNDWTYTSASSYTYNASSVVVSGGYASLGQDTIPSANITAYYRLNDDATDDSGNSFDGTESNMTYAAGKLDNAGVFNGASSSISIDYDSNMAITTQDFSISLWFYISALPSATKALVTHEGFGAIGWDAYINSSNFLRFYIYNGGSVISSYQLVAGHTGSWHNVVYTVDRSSMMRTYFDNVEVASADISAKDGLSLLANTSSPSVYIGSYRGTSFWFDGNIDDVAIFRGYLLTESDRDYIYNSGTGREAGFSPVYITTDPSIETNIGYVFNDPLQEFVETVVTPANTAIKYQLSSDNGVTFKYWTGAIWSNSDGTYTQSNTATDTNNNIGSLATSGTLKVKALLHTSDTSVTPELDNITVRSDVAYSTGSYVIAMNTDIQPTINNGYETVTETVVNTGSTTVEYQYSTNNGSTYNGSWLSSTTLQSALIALSPVGDGSDTIRFKFQLTTSSSTDTPEIDNLNITSDGGTGSTAMYHVSSGTYSDLTDVNAQLSSLHTDGSPTFSTVTATGFLGGGGYIEDIGLHKETKVSVSAVIDEVSGISKGQIVYFKGSSGGTPTIGIADRLAADLSSIPIGVAAESGSDTDTILVRTQGTVDGLDTSTLTPGNIVYLGTNGSFVDTIPSSGTVRVIGAVTYNHGSTGSIFVALHESIIKSTIHGQDYTVRLGSTTSDYVFSIRNFENVEVASITATGDAYFNSINGSGGTFLTESSATVTYLNQADKAADSELLDGYNYDYFLDTTTAASSYLTTSSATATYLTQSSATVTYLPIPNEVTDNLILKFDWEGTIVDKATDTISGTTATVTTDVLQQTDVIGTMNAMLYDADADADNQDYVAVPGADIIFSSGTSYTWSMWVNATGPGESSKGYPMSKFGGADTFYFSTSNFGLGCSRLSILASSPVGTSQCTGSSNLYLNDWVLITAVLDAETDTAKIYIDDYKSINTIYTIHPDFGSWTESTTAPLVFGNSEIGGARCWEGYIGVVRIYDKALTKTEIERNRDADIKFYGMD